MILLKAGTPAAAQAAVAALSTPRPPDIAAAVGTTSTPGESFLALLALHVPAAAHMDSL
jgi:hypothetical protein